MALRIVEGQHLDLAHEGEWSGGEDRYLAMIAGKTAAILSFAAQAGAQIAGAAPAVVAACGEFGLSLGLAFQIHDDWLGIWGEQAVTGKPTADDIRRRKQSLPIVALDERANAADRATLRELYAAPAPLADAAVATIMALLAEYNIDAYCQQRAADYHDQTRLALTRLAAQGIDTSGLQDYLDLLVQRTH
jgi:geranylgeranyl diphosphate synthase type I